MALPVLKIIWAANDPGSHWNHLHVEGIPKQTGTPPPSNPGMTDSVWAIYVALSEKFGEPAYMTGGDWNHMGWYNRRYIAGTTVWTQHSWSNAIDIGPYYGVEEQQRFYDFLTSEEDDGLDFIIQTLKSQNMAFFRALQQKTGTPGGNPDYWGSDYTGAVKPSQGEWEAAAMKLFAAALQTGVFAGKGVDDVARAAAAKANTRLDNVRASL